MSLPATYTPISLTRMETQDLRAELGRAITMTADSLAYLAGVWAELERRGEDLSDLKIGLAPYLRDVASGRLAPEAVLTFAGRKMVLKWVARQPYEQQKKLAAEPTVTISTPAGKHKTALLTDLNANELRFIDLEADAVEPETKQKKRAPSRNTVGFSVSPAEHKKLLKDAAAANQTVADYVRSKLGFKTVAE